MFSYRVSVLDPTLKITDSSVSNFGGFLINVNGFQDLGLFIKEDIGTAPGSDNLGTMSAEFSYLAGSGLTSYDGHVVFAPQSEIWVTKNILVWASDLTDNAYLTSFDQRFSQTPVGLPEPGMLALLALGGIALLKFKRS
jgi:hypothetical protein